MSLINDINPSSDIRDHGEPTAINTAAAKALTHPSGTSSSICRQEAKEKVVKRQRYSSLKPTTISTLSSSLPPEPT